MTWQFALSSFSSFTCRYIQYFHMTFTIPNLSDIVKENSTTILALHYYTKEDYEERWWTILLDVEYYVEYYKCYRLSKNVYTLLQVTNPNIIMTHIM